jgi:lactose/L-arabinose transport system substrate-binding protein
MLKRFMLGIGTLAVGSMLLTACGSTSSSSSGGSSSGPVTIKVVSWNDAADALTEEIAGFNKKYPNIHVQVLKDSNYSKVLPALAAGTGAPDIIQTQARDFPAFMKKFPGAFVDITDKTKDLKDKFISSAWEPVTSNGKVYGMPWDLGPAALYYRKDLFEKAGIDPNSLKTWDDFISAGKQLQSKVSGVSMTAYGDDYDMYEMFLNELGGSYVTDGKIDIQSDASTQALSMEKKMKDAGIAIDINDWNGRITALTNNKLASIVFPVWYAGTLQNSLKDQAGKWGIVPLPAFTSGGNNQANLGGSALGISKQSQHADAAWKFLNYCLATDEGETVMLKYGLFPSYTPFYNNSEFKKNNDFFGQPLYPFFASLTKNIPVMDHGPIMLDAGKPLTDMISSVLAGTSISQATKTAADAISKSSGLPTK